MSDFNYNNFSRNSQSKSTMNQDYSINDNSNSNTNVFGSKDNNNTINSTKEKNNYNTSGNQLMPGTKNYDKFAEDNLNINSVSNLATGMRIADQRMKANSRVDSRIVYQTSKPGVIIHEHPSRPVRSPSPITTNPNSNIIPHTNFIYNSSNSFINNSSPRLPSMPVAAQLVPLSPAKFIETEPLSSQKLVSRAVYDRCVYQCKNWQQKYNQLYILYMKSQDELKASQSHGNTMNNTSMNSIKYSVNNSNNAEEIQNLSKQSRRLKQRVRELETNNQKLSRNMDDIVVSLVNKYRESLVKQAMLLIDRYRLQKKMENNNRY